MVGADWGTVRVALATVGLLATPSGGTTGPAAAQLPSTVETIPVTGGFYMLAGAGGNIGVQIGVDGVVLVDAGSAGRTDGVLAAVRALTDQPIRFIINTSADADHVGGNEQLAQAGRSIVAAANAFNAIFTGTGAAVIGHENVLRRMSAPTGAASPFPTNAWPTSTFVEKQKVLYLNREGVQVMHRPSAHSDGDSIVFFRRSDVFAVGDIIDSTLFPRVDVERGGTIEGVIDTLNYLVEMSVSTLPLGWLEGGTKIVPGHGRVMEQADVIEYRDMVTIVRDRIRDGVRRGLTLDEIRIADPVQGFRRRYGSDTGPWTTDMFIDAVHRTLESEP
jgi:glyoxylase-like metal-dependent hydrolase (beta-lactamase superfamily II)